MAKPLKTFHGIWDASPFRPLPARLSSALRKPLVARRSSLVALTALLLIS